MSPQVLPAPSKVLRTAFKLAVSGSLLNDLGVSLLRAAIGFTIGGSIAFALGILVGFSRFAEALIDRSVQMIRAIPFLALLPLVIVWFGVDEGEKIFLVSLGVAFPIYINTTLGIRQVDPKLLELGRVQGLGKWQLVRRIILPGALPSILTGVRYSLENPHAYVDSNLVGFVNMLELCRHRGVQHLVYASSSSVYGDSATPPFSEDQRVDQPRSLYAATKAANELMAYTYAQLYGLHATGLRFFTVYGPWGRPDMAPLLFSRAVLAGRPIDVFNEGRMQRDFTHVSDIVSGILGALAHPADGPVPHRVFNLGNHTPVELERFISVIEQAAGRPAQKVYKPMQPGDMVRTMADTRRAHDAFGFDAVTPIEEGLPPVVQWCREYFGDRA